MSKSLQNIEETLQRFLTNPEDIENNVVLKRIEDHMKGQFKIKIKVNYPIVLDANGIPQQAHYDSLYIADPAKQKPFLDTQKSMSKELIDRVKDANYFGDSQSVMKKEEDFSVIQISRNSIEDPRFEEFAKAEGAGARGGKQLF